MGLLHKHNTEGRCSLNITTTRISSPLLNNITNITSNTHISNILNLAMAIRERLCGIEAAESPEGKTLLR